MARMLGSQVGQIKQNEPDDSASLPSRTNHALNTIAQLREKLQRHDLLALDRIVRAATNRLHPARRIPRPANDVQIRIQPPSRLHRPKRRRLIRNRQRSYVRDIFVGAMI